MSHTKKNRAFHIPLEAVLDLVGFCPPCPECGHPGVAIIVLDETLHPDFNRWGVDRQHYLDCTLPVAQALGSSGSTARFGGLASPADLRAAHSQQRTTPPRTPRPATVAEAAHLVLEAVRATPVAWRTALAEVDLAARPSALQPVWEAVSTLAAADGPGELEAAVSTLTRLTRYLPARCARGWSETVAHYRLGGATEILPLLDAVEAFIAVVGELEAGPS